MGYSVHPYLLKSVVYSLSVTVEPIVPCGVRSIDDE